MLNQTAFLGYTELDRFLTNTPLGTFAYLFTNTMDFEFSFLVLSLSGFGTQVTLTLQKEVKNVLSFSIS